MRARKEGKIEKPEDKDWNQWYEKLGHKDHEKMLAQLGLDKEDIDEWEHHSVFKEMEEGSETPVPEEKPKKKK
jgi:hypothetical protein